MWRQDFMKCHRNTQMLNNEFILLLLSKIVKLMEIDVKIMAGTLIQESL